MRIWTLALAAAVSVAGCDNDDDGTSDEGAAGTDDTSGAEDGAEDGAEGSGGDDTAGAQELDEDAILAAALAYADMVRISNEPRESEHSLADTVHFYVPAEHRALYETLDPDGAVAATAPEGMLIVKENLDADGNPDGFFAMYKAYPGYNPDSADWYWLRVGADGTPADRGKVGFCASCHARAETSDYMFGVPLDNRN